MFLFKYPKIRINPEWNGKIAQKWMEMAEKRAKPHITVELSFNCCHDQAPFPCFLLLSSPRSSFSLPLFVTRDHVSPLDLCWNMDEEMREMRAYGSLLNLILFIPLLLLLISVILTLFRESDESDVWALPLKFNIVRQSHTLFQGIISLIWQCADSGRACLLL